VCDFQWGLDWILDSLTTHTHKSESQVIIVPLLMSTLYETTLFFFPAFCVFTSRSLVTALNSGILQLPLSGSLWMLVSFQLTLFFRLLYRTDSVDSWQLYYDRRSVGQFVLVWSPHLGLMTRFLLLSDNCWFVDMGRPLWREDRSVVYNCCCLRQRSHSQVRVPRGSWPHFTVSDSRLPFSSPPTTRRVTVEVFDPASTREMTRLP
jgi:hypothetical protein